MPPEYQKKKKNIIRGTDTRERRTMQHYLVSKTQEMKNIEHMRINMMVNGMPSKEYKDS